jgi:predicted signal transduction protein with EAL and GGDEF domain
VLAELARRLSAVPMSAGLAARVDGDEFAVLILPPVDEPAVALLAQRLKVALQEPLDLPSFRGSVTVSGGVTITDGMSDVADPDAVLRDAGIAMARAKQQGGRATVVFEASMRADVLMRRSMERRLARAVPDDEIVVHFEPVVSLLTGEIVACEALARWRVDGALLAPSEWIPIAESTGHIIAVGERVFDIAAGQLGDWTAAGHVIRVAVNVSARQLLTSDLRRAVECALGRGLAPTSLCLEVTESVAVDETAVNELTRLRNLGVLIALDDFGTGYSSLGSISRLPIDIVKIDRSFTARLGQRDGDALATTVLALADTLDLAVIAEGIETVAQARTLAEIGCEFGQGYLFGRAMPASEFRFAAVTGWSATTAVPAQSRSRSMR